MKEFQAVLDLETDIVGQAVERGDAGQNQAQFALLTSPFWLPAAALGLKALGRLLGRKSTE